MQNTNRFTSIHIESVGSPSDKAAALASSLAWQTPTSPHAKSTAEIGAKCGANHEDRVCLPLILEESARTWVFPKIGVGPQNGWWKYVKIMENPIKVDDLGGKPTIFGNIHMQLNINQLSRYTNSVYTGYIWEPIASFYHVLLPSILRKFACFDRPLFYYPKIHHTWIEAHPVKCDKEQIIFLQTLVNPKCIKVLNKEPLVLKSAKGKHIDNKFKCSQTSEARHFWYIFMLSFKVSCCWFPFRTLCVVDVERLTPKFDEHPGSVFKAAREPKELGLTTNWGYMGLGV